MNDQAQRLRELSCREGLSASGVSRQAAADDPGRLPRSIAVTSGKGGVGKSNIAIFLATAFVAAKKRVLLLDADLGLANAHILLGIAPRHTLSDVIDERCSFEETIVPAPGGFDLLPGASGLEKMANLDAGRLQLLGRNLRSLERNYDILLADTGAGIGSTVTHFASSADRPLVVLTPEPTSFADAYAMVKVLYERGAGRIGIIVNMAASDRDGLETFDKLNALTVKFLKQPVDLIGILPYWREVGGYVRRQRQLLLEKRASPFAERISGIARRIGCGGPAARGLFERLWGMFA